MEHRHPYADAAYRIVPQGESMFGVEVAIADAYPTTVTSFATEVDAEAWISAHKERVASSASLRGRTQRWGASR